MGLGWTSTYTGTMVKSPKNSILGFFSVHCKKNSLFIFLFILWGISPSRRSLGTYAVGGNPAIFLCSHVPMERFFDGTDQENSKTQGGKGQISKNFKTRRKEWRKEKKRFWRRYVPILVCSPSVRKAREESPGATALMQPSLWRTHSYGNLPYNINIVSLDAIRVLKPEFMNFWAKYSL